MTINKPHLCTVLEIWSPKYSSAYKEGGEWVVLLAEYKVTRATPVIIVKFTKTDHLKGLRFAIKRENVLKQPIETNGKIRCYAVPFSKLQGWNTPQEVKDIAMGAFDD